MALDLPRREIVERDGIPVRATASGLRRIARDRTREGVGDLRCGEQGGLGSAPGTGGMAVAPDRMPPLDNLVLRVETSLYFDRHSRAEWRVGHFIGAGPLHAHGPPAG